MTHHHVHDVERAKWDAHAATALGDEDVVPADMTFERWAAGSILMDRIPQFLGDLQGRRVLEYGCGLGQMTVHLARSGAQVTAFDLSPESINVARRRAELNDVADRVEFVEAPGEALPFVDGAFDIAVGKAVLHHLEPKAGARELARVLAPGGRAAFSEPLGINPLLVFVRNHVPYPRKHERGSDRPLTRSDLRDWAAPFASMRMEPIQLLSMVERGLGFGKSIPPLRKADELLFRTFPALGPLARYAFLFFEAPVGAQASVVDKSESADAPVVVAAGGAGL